MAVDVALQNSDEVTAVEVVVPLVDRQLTYVDGSCVINSERANGHQLNAAVVDGALKIYIYNISLAPMKGNDGKVASFNIKLGKSPAEYPLQPQVVLSDAAGKALTASVTSGSVTILAPQIEIVTQSVDFGHIPIMAQYTKTLTLRNSGTLPLEVMGMEFSASEFSATENSFTIAVGATKSISVAYSPTKRGAIEESIAIISNAVNGKATATLISDPYSVNELHSSRAEGIAGEEVTVELRMNNMEPIVGLQTMFTLPTGVEYVDGSFAPTERASSHTAMASVSDKQLTLILYSSKNTPMEGNDGVVATFRLRLDCNSGSYKITPQNTLLGNATVENMVSAVSGNYIVVKSPNISGNKELDFGKTPVTEIAKANYSIKNSGKATLVISSVSFLSTGYRVANELPLSIEPGATGVLNVEFTPTTEGEHSTTMNIYSNDPDEKMKSVKVSGTVYEPNNLTFEGENLQNGNYVVSIGLDNYTGIVAVQMDIHFMPGMTTSNDYLKVTQRLAGHSCSVTKIDEDTYRFIAFSFNNNSIAGNEGKLFDLTFVPNSGVEYKDAPIVIDNVVLSSSEANNYTSQLTLNAKAEYSNYYVRFVCDGEVVSESFQRAGSSIVQPRMPERTGYTFAGWKGVPELSPAEDVVYTGEYKVNKYKLDYLVNGVVFATDSIAYGSVITLIEAPIREGHTFSGWSEAPATMPAEDIVIEGSFAVNTYNVIYKVDGAEYKVVPVVYGSEITLIDVPVKEGYTFSGWSEAPATMPAEDVVIEGTFAVNTYSIIYNVDGAEYKVVPVTYGSEITLIDAPVKEGYTFSGWSEAPATMPAEDVIIEGSFTVNYYTITYIVDGEVYATETIAYGSEITLIDAPTKEGYTFSGWSEAPATMPAEDVVIEGTFAVNYYTVTYLVDGEVYATETIAYGSEIVLRDEPTKEGHTFSGWSEAPATMPAEDVVIEGSFIVNYYTITYDVDYEVYAIDSVAYGSEIILRDKPIKEGYTFRGWSAERFPNTPLVAGHRELAESRDPNGIPTVMPAYNFKVYGGFTVNYYTVTYIVDGEVYATETVAYGSEITLIGAPVKEGHTFSGWSEAPATMPAEDITIEGSFIVNYYTITYDVDYEVYAIDSVAYGSEIILRDKPIKEGYTFRGWSAERFPNTPLVAGHRELAESRDPNGIPTVMPAYNFKVYGGFTVNYYTVTYIVDGEVYATETIAYGSEIVLRDEPTAEGHTFSGWSEFPEVMPAEDVTIEGTFAVNYYTVTYMVDGEVYATETIAYGSEITLIEEPVKEGHTFSGWSEAPATMPAEDVVIEGSFSPITTINGVVYDAEDLIIYNLRGERIIDVDELEQGLYIINGKKVWVK